MGTIPAVPTFPAGYAATGAALQQLGQAVTWLQQQKPLAILTQGIAQSVGNNANTAVTWDTKVTDRDQGWSSGSNTRYTAQTPGYYWLTASTPFNASGTGSRRAMFRVTTGAGNPAGAGVTTVFGCAGAKPVAGDACGPLTRSLTPYMYVADYIEVLAWQNSGGALLTSLTSRAVPLFTITLASG